MQKISWTEYYRIIVTLAYICLGLIILVRAVSGGYNFIVAVLGILFVLFGLYRLKHVYRYLKEKRAGSIL